MNLEIIGQKKKRNDLKKEVIQGSKSNWGYSLSKNGHENSVNLLKKIIFVEKSEEISITDWKKMVMKMMLNHKVSIFKKISQQEHLNSHCWVKMAAYLVKF